MLNFDYSALESNSQLKTFARRACSTVQGVQHTYILAREALKVEGVFVECGVGYGANAAAMLQASIDAGDQRPLHLFDSFQGIPLAGPEDDQQPGLPGFKAPRDLPIEERLVSSGVTVAPLDDVKSHFKEWNLPLDDVYFHEGWFQYTMPQIRVGRIAMLRLDADMNESTACCLEWLYPHVVSGGIVLVDDWTLGGVQKAIRKHFASRRLPDMPVTVDTGACYWIKP